MKYYLGFLKYDPAIDGTNVPIGWKTIAWFQRSDIVHCFMVYEEKGQLFCYETTETIFHKIPLSERLAGSRCEFYELPGDAAAALQFSKSLIDKPYDYPAIAFGGLILALERLCKWIVWPIEKVTKQPLDVRLFVLSNPYQLNDFWFCSESCIGAMHHAGIWMPQHWGNGSTVWPSWLYKFVKDQSEIFGTPVALVG